MKRVKKFYNRKNIMLKLSPQARQFLLENNTDLLLLLEDGASRGSNQQGSGSSNQQDDGSDGSDGSSSSQDNGSDGSDGSDGLDGSGDLGTSDGDLSTADPDTSAAIMGQSIDIADQKFIQFRLYDKINELQDMIKNLQNLSVLDNTEVNTLESFTDYVNILNELIFVMDVNVIYQLVGQIEIDLAQFLKEVDIRIKAKNANFEKVKNATLNS
jgi:hypothetical protein